MKPDLAAPCSPVCMLAGCWASLHWALQAVCVGAAFAWLPAEPRQELAPRGEEVLLMFTDPVRRT